MSYFDEEYYDQALFPELESEMETLIDHVTNTIKEEAIDNIVVGSKKYQELKQVNKDLNDKHWGTMKDLNTAQKEIENLKAELDKKLNEHPHFKFKVGDQVYVPWSDGSYPKLRCAKCNGTGRLVFNVQDAEVKEATAVCPLCGGYSRDGYVREGCYAKWVPHQKRITEIAYTITEDASTTRYCCEGGSYAEDEIAFNRAESVKICQQKTVRSYNVTAKATGHPEVEAVDQIP